MKRNTTIWIAVALLVLMCVIVNLMQRQVINDQSQALSETEQIDSVIDSLVALNTELENRIDILTTKMDSIDETKTDTSEVK